MKKDGEKKGDDKKKVDTGLIPEHALEIATAVKECERDTGSEKSDSKTKHHYVLDLKNHKLKEVDEK